MSDDKTIEIEPVPVDKTERAEPVKTVASEELLQGARELRIEHEGEFYRLRLTSRGKLFLTK